MVEVVGLGARPARPIRKRLRKSRDQTASICGKVVFVKRTQAKAIERDLDKKMVLLSGPQLVGDLRVESESKGLAILRAFDWLEQLERPTR